MAKSGSIASCSRSGNGKLLRAVLLAAWLPAVPLAGCDQSPAEAAQEYLESARERYRLGEIQAAIIDLKNALQEEPDNAQARRLLGRAYLRLGDVAAADKELSRAWDLGLRDRETDLLLARVALARGDFAAVLDRLAEAPDGPAPLAAETYALRGEALLALGRVEPAARSFEASLALDPRPEAYAGLARVAIEARRLDAAERHLEEGLALAPDSARLHELSGHLSLSLGRAAEAEASYRRALELDPGNLQALTGLASMRLRDGDYAGAGALLDRAGPAGARSLGLVLLRSYAALGEGDYAAAQEAAEAILGADGGLTTALYVSGISAYALGRTEQARRRLGHYLELVPGDGHARAVFERLSAPREGTDAAQGTPAVDPSLLEPVSGRALEAGLRQFDLRRRAARVAAAPDDPKLRAELSLAEALSGDFEQAEQELTRALDLEGQLEDAPEVARAAVVLALGHIQRRDFEAAVEAARRLQERLPEATVGHTLEGIALAGQARYEEALAALERARALQPDSPATLSNLAVIQLAKGDPEAAHGLLRQAIEENPGHYPTLLRLGQLSLQLGRRDEARRWLESALAGDRPAVAARILLARIFLSEGAAARAAEVTEAGLQALGTGVVGTGPGTAPGTGRQGLAQEAALLALLGTARLELGQSARAVDAFERLVERVPASAEAQFRLARAYAQAGRAAAVEERLRLALERDPGHLGARLGLAELALGRGDPEAAAPLVESLAADRPEDPRVLNLRADLALRRGELGQARALLRQLHERAPSTASAVRLAGAQWRDGDRDAALETLESWTAGHGEDVAARLQLGTYYTMLDRREAGLRQFEAILERQPDNWVALNQAAWLLHLEGAQEAALEHARKAHARAPEHPAVLDTLGVVLTARGAAAEALPLLARAAELAPDDPQIAFHHARALAETGQRQKAREVLGEIVSRNDDFPDYQLAKSLLEKLEHGAIE